ncbi:MAG: hypothetical protein J6J36_07230 [Clostridia bacterium]|nr:hypothetical protein [Clostridia bacterium]
MRKIHHKIEKIKPINIQKLEVGWDSTSSEGSYYVFNSDDTYYWYKSSSDLDDNYYKGEMTILHGTEAIEDLGISYENVSRVFVNSKGSISLDNIYELKLHPTYLISGGIDKTSTLTSKFDMKLLFVYVDENNAQAFNYTTQDTYYFVKKDK